MRSNPKRYTIVLHDGDIADVHRSCQPRAAEYIRQSRLTAQDEDYARMTQNEQLNQIDKYPKEKDDK